MNFFLPFIFFVGFHQLGVHGFYGIWGQRRESLNFYGAMQWIFQFQVYGVGEI